MARTFNGTSDKILMSLGAIPTTVTGLSMVAICNPTAVSRWNNILSLLTSADAQGIDMTISNGNVLTLEASADSDGTVTSVGTGWQLLAITKASGVVAPKGHRYVYSTGVWTHTTSGGTQGDPPGTIARPYFGALGATDFFQGDLATVAFWDRALSDAEIELLPYTLQAWLSLTPKALWTLDQAATTHKIIDWTGGGANENTLTGTTVSANSVPLFNFSDGPWPVTHAASGSGVSVTAPAGALVLAGDAPTLTYGGQATAPAGALVLAGLVPTLKNAITSPAGALVLSGDVPTIKLGPTAPAGNLVLGATAPTLTLTGSATAPAGVLLLDGIPATINTGTPAPPESSPTSGGWINYYH